MIGAVGLVSVRAGEARDNKEIEGAGWMSIIVDPTGAMLGLWRSRNA